MQQSKVSDMDYAYVISDMQLYIEADRLTEADKSLSTDGSWIAIVLYELSTHLFQNSFDM